MDPQMFGMPENEQEFLVKNGDHHGTKFLRDGITYYFPDYLCIISNKKDKVTFHLLVEDVLPQSHKLAVDDDERSVCLKFCVIKLDPDEARHYAFMVKLPVLSIEDCDVEITENQVILTVPFQPDDGELSWYLCGRTDSELIKRQVEQYELKIEDTTLEDTPPPSDDEEVEGDWPTTDL